MSLPTIARRVIAAVLAVNAVAAAGIVVAMWITDDLAVAVRVPIAALLIALMCAVWIRVLHRRMQALIEQPLAEHVAIADAIANGDTSRRLGPAASLEFERLAGSVNRMSAQLAAAHELRVRAEKLATLGRMAAGVSHEIGNPLSAIANYAHVIRMRARDVDSVQAPLEAMEREIARIDRIMRGLLEYSRPRRMTPRPTVVDDVVTEALELLADQGITRNVRLDVALGATVGLVHAERHDLVQVFVNLLLNAVDAMDEGGTVGRAIAVRSCVLTRSEFEEQAEHRRTDGETSRWHHRPSTRAAAWLARVHPPDRFVQIIVADSGRGVAREDEDRIFEPFYSTKQPGKGTGLGLAIVASTIEGLGGTVWVQRAREGGAAFVLLLPLHGTMIAHTGAVSGG